MKKMKTVSSDNQVQVHPFTNSSTFAWQEIRVHQKVGKVTPMDPSAPILADHIRFVCLSDTHLQIEKGQIKIPDGDVLLHAGDFTNTGLPIEVKTFNDFLGTLPHKLKIVIAGNHELSFDYNLVKNDRQHLSRYGWTRSIMETMCSEYGITSVKELMTNCVYLQDSGVSVCGINIWGSPWQPVFCGWGFNLERGQPLLDKWNLIPESTDILITHGPPIGYGDRCFDGQHVGCVELLSTVQQRVRPKYHLFGHIHEDYGMKTDGYTTFINASICTVKYRPTNPPVVFDIPVPEGFSKADLIEIKLLKPMISEKITTGSLTSTASVTTTVVPVTTAAVPVTTATVPATTATVPATTATVPATTATVPVLLETITAAPLTILKEPMTTSTFLVTNTTFPMTTSIAPKTAYTLPQTTSAVPITTPASQDWLSDSSIM
ncbi:hypothetical protein ACJMK2_024439 [Sinanodonta woodiana]|uniref:Calcineurin-like phosphoesterase domain-containing protein n=1 Tax=Sinanodonta woodiana TaxID=1069815 RepID=A0ABD3XFE8_SINWO